MAQKTITVLACDICGKPKKEDQLSHKVSLDGEDALEVCDQCAARIGKLLVRIANPPKRQKKAKAE